MNEELLETLRLAQRLGFFGQGDVSAFADHALGYLPPLLELPSGSTVVDLGSGGGLPGLVIASERPDLRVSLVDRRKKRTDFLERAVRRLDLVNTSVLCRDTAHLDGVWQAVTARGFPPELFLECCRDLLAPGGLGVVSEPPNQDRWGRFDLETYGLQRVREGSVSRFVRR